jgi:hypothetical protein
MVALAYFHLNLNMSILYSVVFPFFIMKRQCSYRLLKKKVTRSLEGRENEDDQKYRCV